MRLLLLLLLSTLTFFTYVAQDTLTPKEFRALRQKMAKEDINNLKNGVLLVQLKTKQRTIDAYLKKGLDKKATKIKEKQELDNRNIIKGFDQYFDFCPVYFYYSTDKKKLQNNDFKHIRFLDSNLNFIPLPIDLDTTTYYIAYIGTNDNSNTTLNNIPGYKQPYNDAVQFEALIILNDRFQQLSSPFPYYTKTHEKVKIENLKRWETIQKMNKRLHHFYRQAVNL